MADMFDWNGDGKLDSFEQGNMTLWLYHASRQNDGSNGDHVFPWYVAENNGQTVTLWCIFCNRYVSFMRGLFESVDETGAITKMRLSCPECREYANPGTVIPWNK